MGRGKAEVNDGLVVENSDATAVMFSEGDEFHECALSRVARMGTVEQAHIKNTATNQDLSILRETKGNNASVGQVFST